MGDGCSGKVRHKTEGAAFGALKRSKNAALSVYRCNRCGHYHLGNSRKDWKQQARIDQLLKGNRP